MLFRSRYVTQKDDAEIIASEGVLLGTAEEMARSFRWQCLLNPDVAKHASAASADTRRSLGPEGRAGFAPRTWARSGHCRYLPKKRGE